MQQLIQYVFISLPEALIFLFFTLVLMGINWKAKWKQGLLFSVLQSLLALKTYDWLPQHYYIRLMINTIFILVLFKIIFSFSWKKSALFTFVRVISQILFESLILFIFLQVLQLTPQQITAFPTSIITAWSYYILVILLALYLNQKQTTIPNITKLYEHYKLTALLWVWCAILLTITINSLFMFYTLTYPSRNYVGFSIMLMFGLPLFSALLASYIIYRVAQNMATLTMRQTEEVYLEYLDELITHFRSQRHDFLNHMQVVYGLAKIGNLEGILRYLEDLNLEADETLSLLQIKHPPMAALLRAKAATAIVKQIQFQVNVQTSLDKLSIRPFELVKVIGNIIDNAFDEEIKAPEQQRYVEVSIEEESPSYISIHVFNRNSYIKPEEQELIFRQGYTKKQDHHSGTGLAVSKQIVQKYNGKIDIWSEPEQGTRFSVTLPANAKGQK